MRFASLGSGSRGNATLIQWEQANLLLDCGFTLKETERRLARLGVRAEALSAVLVTHEHGDHIRGVGPLARKYRLPVYMTAGTCGSKGLEALGGLNLIDGHGNFSVAGVKIYPVVVPHDAREPTQFIFEAGDRRLGVLTDLGSITPHVEECYRGCDALVLEANHDPVMLAGGPYPPSLKRRVGGPWGHLSNQQAAGFLQRFEVERLQHLVVAHISQKNNTEALARQALAEASARVAQVHYACQEAGFDWLVIE